VTPMHPERPSDRERLRRVLDSGKLTRTEADVFKKKYEQLVSGKLAELTDGDRRWVGSIYYERGVGEMRFASRQKARKVEDDQSAAFDALPRPKKPPGR
jgi:hypothetical protein